VRTRRGTRRQGGKAAGRQKTAGATLWGTAPDTALMTYTVADDREWDARLLRWDILGSLGHAEGLRKSRLISGNQHLRLQRLLRAAHRAAATGRLSIGPEHEDVHSAVELWLTRRDRTAGGTLHTGRSRNDQVALDLRLYLKDRMLELHRGALALAETLVVFATTHRTALWPGFTHQRRAMPSSAGLWAMAYADGLLDTAESLGALWSRLDRSPLGSAAGYGVPLPLNRRATARALGFREIDLAVAGVQNGRGKLEAAVLHWCSELGHEMAKLSADVILFSAEEFGWLRLPAALATGSSIMPQKRNPDLFELTRARSALVEGNLFTVHALKAKLPGGYHRDFQFLKAPLMQGIELTAEMLAMMASAIPRLEIDRARGRSALSGDILATDEALRRARLGVPFREAYQSVAAELKRGIAMPALSDRAILEARRSAGAAGNLELVVTRRRIARARRWNRVEQRRFDAAMSRLRGRRST
jgi:argininosuccinate lyase